MGKPKTRHNRTSKKGKVFSAGRGVSKEKYGGYDLSEQRCKKCNRIPVLTADGLCEDCAEEKDTMKGEPARFETCLPEYKASPIYVAPVEDYSKYIGGSKWKEDAILTWNKMTPKERAKLLMKPLVKAKKSSDAKFKECIKLIGKVKK